VHTVQRHLGADGRAAVYVSTSKSGGSAIIGKDFQPIFNHSLVWHDGDDLEKELYVKVLNDGTPEETAKVFTLFFHDAVGATLNDARAQTSITLVPPSNCAYCGVSIATLGKLRLTVISRYFMTSVCWFLSFSERNHHRLRKLPVRGANPSGLGEWHNVGSSCTISGYLRLCLLPVRLHCQGSAGHGYYQMGTLEWERERRSDAVYLPLDS